MIQNGMYYIKDEYKSLVKSLGGEWNDTKDRPLVCLIPSTENPNLYWAIPVGKENHRNEKAMNRIHKFMNYPKSDQRSCYYHLGRTTARSIFFVSDAIPITDKYIRTEHLGADAKHFILKNRNLASELERKLKRILSVENSRPNYFRQHITDVKNYLLEELES